MLDSDGNLPLPRELFDFGSCARCVKAGTAEVPMLRCSRCKVVRYCGRTCQKADWVGGHKLVCVEQPVNGENGH